MTGNIDLVLPLVSEIPGVREANVNLNSCPDPELKRLATTVVQPYLDQKLAIRVNGTRYPVRIEQVLREGNLLSIWVASTDIAYRDGDNSVVIDYRLFLDDIDATHLNLGYLYVSDASGDALRQLFEYAQPAGQYGFDANSKPWETSVRWVTPEAAPQPASGAKHDPSPSPVGKGLSQQQAVAATVDATVPKPAPVSEPKVVRPNPAIPQGSNQPLVAGTAAGARPAGSTWATIGQFVRLGIEHILTGYDHIAFLVALIVIGLSIREVLKIITAFTIAHSITLLLAALQIVNLNSRLVECSIALSICYVALENLFRKKVEYRWAITFAFGLVHGFGFASALQEIIVGKSNLVLSVLSFNLGVETGQLMIFALLLPVLHFLKCKVEFRNVTAASSAAVFVLGFTWLVERVFDLKLLPI